jgi:beta-galactosidase
MRFGVDYYPEHWPEDRWETDARLMQEAGFNTVRLAEFAWSKIEPKEGVFEFEWLLRIIDILYKYGIEVVIGTPTAAPPMWLCTNKPNILRVNEDRLRITPNHRQQCCINHPDYKSAADRIVTAIAETLGKNKAVIGWQVDNEFGPLCYCEECRRQFQEWLEAKYGSLGVLNEAWGTVFWSQTFTDWEQIPLPWRIGGPPNPSLALDFRRFFSDCYAGFLKRQIEIIRKFSDKPITHNFMGLWPEVLNYQKLASQLDFVSWDNYPFGGADPTGVSASHDLVRGYLNKNFWVMEQMSGPGGWSDMSPAPRKGRIRAWTYHAIGRGADGIIYFRWRPCRSGLEQYWHGILNHDGSVSRRYYEIKQTRDELKRFEHLIEGTTIDAQVAFINDYDSRFAFQYQRGNQAFSYTSLLLTLYRSFYNRNIPVDIISSIKDLSRYKIVVAPALFVLTEDVAENLKEYVRSGGTLVITFRSAVKDATGLIYNEPLPARLQDVFGAIVKEYNSPHPDEVTTLWGLSEAVDGHCAKASVWLDIMELRGAEPLIKYDAGFMPGGIAVTRNRFGKGTAYYIGTQMAQDCCDLLTEMIIAGAGVSPGIETPEGVDASVRKGPLGSLLFITNHTERPASIPRPKGYITDMIAGGPAPDIIHLDSYEIAVLGS